MFGATGEAENYDGFAAAPDGTGGLWVAGDAGSQFPTTPDAYQPAYQGNDDGYLLHTDFAGLCPSGGEGVEICAISADNTLSERIHFISQGGNVEAATNIALAVDGMSAYSLHAAQFDTWLPVAPGTHLATVVVEDASGTQHEDQQQFSVCLLYTSQVIGYTTLYSDNYQWGFLWTSGEVMTLFGLSLIHI